MPAAARRSSSRSSSRSRTWRGSARSCRPDEQPGGPVAGGDLRTSIWPAIHPRLLELIRAHHSTIVFTNSRRLAERLAQRLNELAGEELVRAHHGCIAREQRLQIEEDLKAGRMPALVATSSLELGHRHGRGRSRRPRRVADERRLAGSSASAAPGTRSASRRRASSSRSSAATCSRRPSSSSGCTTGAIETTVMPRNPLDVLAQQLVAMAVMDRWTVAELLAIVTRAAPFETLSREALEARARDARRRLSVGRVRRAQGARRLGSASPTSSRAGATPASSRSPPAGRSRTAGCSASSSPARPGTPGRRVGELDEEMVYELRAGMHGDVVVLGASSWRVADITPDRVIVEPAPGRARQAAVLEGRCGRAAGGAGPGDRGFLREAEAELARGRAGRARARRGSRRPRPRRAGRRATSSPTSRRSARSPGALPTDRRIVVERFRDELGDWRLVILSPFGGRVHAPWTLAIEARLRERLGIEAQTIWSDDGIAIRLPEGEGDEARRLAEIEALLFPVADEIEDLVVEAVGGSALFARGSARTRGGRCSCPRRRPGTRTPLWQQRQRAADLLAVASRYGSFPILVETYRECLSDVFDLARCARCSAASSGARSPSTPSRRRKASPFASSLLFDYVAAYMYEGDAPLAERRAGPLALDRDLLRELLGQEELRELLDPEALADLELSLQSLSEERQADDAGAPPRPAPSARRPVDGRGRRPASEAGARGRGRGSRARRRPVARSGPDRRRGSLGRHRGRRPVPRRRRRSPPPGVPEAFLVPWPAALDGLLARWARTHGPFLGPEPARSLGPAGRRRRGCARAGSRRRGRSSAASSARAARSGSGATRRSSGCSAAARSRASGARSSRSTPETLGRFLPAWQGVARVASAVADAAAAARRRGARAPRRGRGPAGRACRFRPPCWSATCCRRASPATSRGCSTSWARSARWRGWAAGASAGTTAASCSTAPAARLLLPSRPARRRRAAVGRRPRGDPRSTSRARGASFYRELPRRGRRRAASATVLDALWDLVWAGEVTNDTFAPLRALRWKRPARRRATAAAAGRLTALGPPEAAGRWSLVGSGIGEPRAGRARPSGSTPLALALLDRHGVLVREAVMAEGHRRAASRRSIRCCAPSRRRAGSGAATSWMASARRSSRSPARWIACGRCAKPGELTGDAAGRARSSPPRIPRTRTAPPCPGPAAARRTDGRSSGPRAPPSCSSTASRPLPGPRRAVAPDPPGVRRPGRAGGRRSRPLRGLVLDGRTPGARDREGRRRAGRGARRPRRAAGGRLRAGLSRACVCAATAPSCEECAVRSGRDRPDAGRRHASPASRWHCGHTWPGGWYGGPRAAAGTAGLAHRRAEGDAVDAAGKNLLIKFDGGLELRTHLGLHGSLASLPPGRGVAPAAVSVRRSSSRCRARSRSASTPRSSSSSSAGPRRPPDDARSRPGPLADDRRPGRGRSPAPGPGARDDRAIGEAVLDQRALAGIGNVVKSQVLWEARVCPWTRLRDVDDATLRWLIDRAAVVLREGAATGRRPPSVHGRAGRPCPRCGTIVQAKEQGLELPRLTYWCPACQPDTRSPA